MARSEVVRHPLVDRDIARIVAFLLDFTTPRSVARKVAALDADADACMEQTCSSPVCGAGKDARDSTQRNRQATAPAVAALGENPYRGTRRDEISPGLRAIPSAGKGVIAFDVKEETRTVRILSITWGGADWMGKIAERAAPAAISE